MTTLTTNPAQAPVSLPGGGHVRRIKALVDGAWYGNLTETPAVRARLRGQGGFHQRVTANGVFGLKAAAGRYHLYVSYACPWAHRAIIYRTLKGLEDTISMSVLHPRWAGPDGWRFGRGDGSTVDHVAGRRFLHEVYRAARPDYTGRVTVPVLWDRQTATIVNNESAEIIRMLNSAFDQWGDPAVDFYPSDLRSQIDALNARLLPEVCRAVYRIGFARSQDAYERALRALFRRLDELERRLSGRRYLLGDRVTESDWHLFATLCRFDAVYHGALRCNLRRLVDYPALSAYARRLHRIPGVARTVRFDHIKRHYYDDLGEIDPTIVALGPVIDYRDAGRGRARPGGDRSHRSPGAERPFRAEVIGLHRFLEQWLKGEVADDHPTRLADALAAEFTVIHPSGRRAGRAAVISEFLAARGHRPADYRIDINDLSLRMLGRDLCLATYRETHAREPARTRLSSAVLERAPDTGRITWLSLQETFKDTYSPPADA